MWKENQKKQQKNDGEMENSKLESVSLTSSVFKTSALSHDQSERLSWDVGAFRTSPDQPFDPGGGSRALTRGPVENS